MILVGKIVHGSGRGSRIGIPTLNLELGFPDLEFGVYAVRVTLGGVLYWGAMNWGGRPTFGEQQPVAEVHVLDFSGDVYGEVAEVEVVQRLRGVEKFGTTEELMDAIAKDIEAVRALG